MLYLLNALIVPFRDERAVFSVRRISPEEAVAIANTSQVISALGHQGSVDAFRALGIQQASLNRISVSFNVDDMAIALVLRQRLPEGAVLTRNEMERIGYDLYLIKRVQ